VFVPTNYDPNVSYSVLLWLHPVGRNKPEDTDAFIDAWQDFCEDNHIILVGPSSPNETGWTPGDADFVMEAVRFVQGAYTTDKRRIIAHGMGVGGQMAFYLGFQKRDTFRGVATTGSALGGSNPKERVANQPLSFFVVAGAKDPLKDSVLDTKNKLIEHKYPVVHEEIPNFGHQYLTVGVLEKLARWMDSLDRM
jgi:poly(3-hydroxybutyrate) depolymerase